MMNEITNMSPSPTEPKWQDTDLSGEVRATTTSLTDAEAVYQPSSASESVSMPPPMKKRKGRPKKIYDMDEVALKEFHRKRNAQYSRRKYFRKKIEIQVLQSQHFEKMNENRRLKREGARLAKLLQKAKQAMAAHERHGVFGGSGPRPSFGFTLSGAPCSAAQQLDPASMPILSSFAAAEQLHASLASSHQQHSFARSLVPPTLQQKALNCSFSRGYPGDSSRLSSVGASDHILARHQPRRDLYQASQVQSFLNAQQHSLDQQGWASAHGVHQESINKDTDSHHPRLRTHEAVGSHMQQGTISADFAASLPKDMTPVTSSDLMVRRARNSSTDFDSASALLQLLQRQQRSEAESESSSSLSALLELLRRRNSVYTLKTTDA